jgi:hypothetical protein
VNNSSLAAIPLAAVLVIAFLGSAIAISVNLLSHRDQTTQQPIAALVFVVGFGVTTVLAGVAGWSLGSDVYSVPDDLLLSPISSISRWANTIGDAINRADAWVHIVLGLSLIACTVTAIGLFYFTDILGAINAMVVGPVFGITLVAIAVLALYVAVIIAAIVAAGAILMLRLALASQQ